MKTVEDLLRELCVMASKLSSTAGEPVDPLRMATGLCSESCEILGIEDKRFYQGQEISDLKAKLEVGDALFYLLGYLNARGYPLRECLVGVIAKLDRRYTNGVFDSELSRERDKEAELCAASAAISNDRRINGQGITA